MAKTLEGPWVAPPDDQLDSRAWYAAKSAGDEDERYIFGWLATRSGDQDTGEWQWGGNLVVYQLIQREDGTLGVTAPQSVKQAFAGDCSQRAQPVLGDWQGEGNSWQTDATGRYSALSLGELPETCRIEATLTWDSSVHGLGLFFKADPELVEPYHELRFEPHRNRLVTDRRQRQLDIPFVLERQCPAPPDGRLPVEVLIDGDCLVAYVDGGIALSARIYQRSGAMWGLFAKDGKAGFESVIVKTP
jgi:beta-fructofuranosidase